MKSIVIVAALTAMSIPAVSFASAADRKKEDAALQQTLDAHKAKIGEINSQFKADEAARAAQIKQLRASGQNPTELAKLEKEQHSAAVTRGTRVEALHKEDARLHSEVAEKNH